MKEWFLLNGVALQCRNISKGDIKSTPFVEADFADAERAFRDLAVMAAGVAVDPFLVEAVVQLALARAVRKDVVQSRHVLVCLSIVRHGGGW